MKLRLWQIDAFSEKPLGGNPAAIVPLAEWIDDGLLQKIADENNLSETAFFVRTAQNKYALRWFTPQAEVDLCGHATLASAWLIFEMLAPESQAVDFATRSGILTVARGPGGRHVMRLPSDPVVPCKAQGLMESIGEALACTPPREVFQGRYLMAVWNDAAVVRTLKGPGEIARLLRQEGHWGLIATAKGDGGYDFVSRFFAPDKGVPEDPVTGSAHCALTPFWAERLGKKELKARQASPRGGDLWCADEGAYTVLSGPCALYMTAEISL